MTNSQPIPDVPQNAPALPCTHGAEIWALIAAFHAGSLDAAEDQRLVELITTCRDCATVWAIEELIYLENPEFLPEPEREPAPMNAPWMDLTWQPAAVRSSRSEDVAEMGIETPLRLRPVREIRPSGVPGVIAFMDSGVLLMLPAGGGVPEQFGTAAPESLSLPGSLGRLSCILSSNALATIVNSCVELIDLETDPITSFRSPAFVDAAFTPSAIACFSELVAVGGTDGRLLSWRIGASHWEVVSSVTSKSVHAIGLTATTLVWGDEAGICRTYQLGEGSIEAEPIASEPILTLAIAQNGAWAIGLRHSLVVMDGSAGASLPTSAARITGLAFDASGRYLAVGFAEPWGDDRELSRIRVYELVQSPEN